MIDTRSLRGGLKRSGPIVTARAVRLDRLSRMKWGRRPRATRPELDDDGVTPVTKASGTVDQTGHRLLCDTLREAVRAGPGAADRISSIRYRALVVLYTLLLDHPIDRRGRCRSCRLPGALIGFRRRPCRIHLRVSCWLLRQSDEALLLSQLVDELEQGADFAGRNGRTKTTAGSGMIPRASDLAVFHPTGLIRAGRACSPEE